MLQQLPDRDLASVDSVATYEVRQVALDRRVEVDLALTDELEDDRGGEGLGVTDRRQGGGELVAVHQRVQALLDGIAVLGRSGAGAGHRGACVTGRRRAVVDQPCSRRPEGGCRDVIGPGRTRRTTLTSCTG